MRLTQAKKRDAPRLADILAECIAETPWMPPLQTPKENLLCIGHLIETCDVLTIRNWRGPQGFLARDGAIIHALYLRPSARGRGQAKRLLETAKARAPRLELWAFQANIDARSFYAHEGFVEVELTDGAGNDEKLPDVRLVWERG